jgi:hypothetical protein
MFKFAKSPATRRHFPRAFSWPERCFGRRRRPPPPRIAAAGASAAALALAGAGSRWIGRGWPRSNRPAGQTGHILVNRGIKVKEPPLASLILHVGPSTLKDPYNSVLNFMF